MNIKALKGLASFVLISMVILLGSLCAPSAKPKPGHGHRSPSPTPTPSPTVTPSPTPVPSPTSTPTPLPPPPTVTLAWDAPNDPSVTGYTLWMGFSSGAENQPTNVGNVLTATVTLTSGTTYFFYVTSVNSVGQSVPSNEISYTAP